MGKIMRSWKEIIKLISEVPRGPTFEKVLNGERNTNKPISVKPVKSNVLIVKPLMKSTFENTKKRIVNELVLKNLHVKVKRMNKILNSGLVVETEDDRNLKKLIQELNKIDQLKKDIV
ncbi:hypothetical protein AVEN_88208-1 [Araneus ventricosus]|uniref:Uncharacterized protein n=1 Tax=Araneus ventricosus TaxID=182803 RepID=A0A4Y2HXK6_ARAVE|nr:hypothetical protein AVEN_88208-1 [Araneus ventricosus]